MAVANLLLRNGWKINGFIMGYITGGMRSDLGWIDETSLGNLVYQIVESTMKDKTERSMLVSAWKSLEISGEFQIGMGAELNWEKIRLYV